MLITLDFDEVLFPLAEPLLQWAKENHFPDLTIKAADTVDYDITPWFGARKLELIEEFYRSEEMQQILPEPGAQQGVTRLLDFGYALRIVTGRPELCYKETREQLLRHFPAMPIYCTDQYYSNPIRKVDVCRELRANAHVDDSLDHCNQMVEAGIRAYFMVRPWKFTKPLDARAISVCNWDELIAHSIPQ